MKLPSLVVASVLTASVSLAAAGPLDLSTGSTGFANTPSSGVFVDTYTFSLASSVSGSGSITTVVNGAQDIDFTQILLTGPSGSFNFTQLLGDPVETWGLLSTPLLPGSYTLTLFGVNSVAGASYGGNLSVSPVSAVPEPSTLGLMLAGLGVIGYIARRRQAGS